MVQKSFSKNKISQSIITLDQLLLRLSVKGLPRLACAFFIYSGTCFCDKNAFLLEIFILFSLSTFVWFCFVLFGFVWFCLVGVHYLYSPSQFFPRNRLLQRQLYPKAVSLQVPPLRHGSDLQNSTTANINGR